MWWELYTPVSVVRVINSLSDDQILEALCAMSGNYADSLCDADSDYANEFEESFADENDEELVRETEMLVEELQPTTSTADTSGETLWNEVQVGGIEVEAGEESFVTETEMLVDELQPTTNTADTSGETLWNEVQVGGLEIEASDEYFDVDDFMTLKILHISKI